jgi:hypothetical protein
VGEGHHPQETPFGLERALVERVAHKASQVDCVALKLGE